MVKHLAARSGQSSRWVRRARLAGIVVAASTVAAVTAFVQACRGGNASSPADASSSSGPGSRPPAPSANEPPVTILIQPAPPGSTSTQPVRVDLSSDLPEAPPPKPSARPPRRGNPDDSGIIYE